MSGAVFLFCFDPQDPVRLTICLVILAGAQISDHVDGWIARNLSTPTLSGYLQDSVADKLFHFGCLLALAAHYDWLAPAVWLICCREFVIMALRVATPNVSMTMRAFKWQSVLYAIFLRAGIAVVSITSLLSPTNLVTIVLSHLPIYMAGLLGIANIVLVFRGSRRSGNQQQ